MARRIHYRCARVYACDTPSASTEGVVYRTSMVDGKPHCTCPGFQYRETCKHVAAMMEIACLWDSRTNPRGSRNPVGTHCPMCGSATHAYFAQEGETR